MHRPMSDRPATSRLLLVAWVAALLPLVFLVVWPWAGGLAVSSDDACSGVRRLLGPTTIGPLLAESWRSMFFRPLDTAARQLIDPATRDARWTAVLHLPALALCIGGLAALARRTAARWRLVLPIALAWWFLHPGTSVSLWQPDTVSQSWSAALGVWLVIAVFRAVDRVTTGAHRFPDVLAPAVLCAVGLLAKETFLGWCAGAAAFVVVVFLRGWHAGRSRRLGPWWCLLAPLVTLPALYLVFRVVSGGLSQSFDPSMGRYTVGLGRGTLTYVATAFAGSICLGPVHAVFSPEMHGWARVMPLLGGMLTITAAALPLLLVRRGAAPATMLAPWRSAAMVAAIALSGLLAPLPTAHLSELYLMGPNLGLALLVGVGAVSTIQVSESASTAWAGRRWVVAVGIVGMVSLYLLGALGLASRARHFQLTWRWSRELQRSLVEFQDRRPPGAPPGHVLFAARCSHGWVHSVYVVPPVHALNLPCTERYLNARDPSRALELVEWSSGQRVLAPALLVDCADLVERPRF